MTFSTNRTHKVQPSNNFKLDKILSCMRDGKYVGTGTDKCTASWGLSEWEWVGSLC